MRAVRVQGCLPVLLLVLAAGALLALAFTAGAVFLVAGLALAVAGAAVRWLTGGGRAGQRPAPPRSRARDMVVDAEGGTRPPPAGEASRLPGDEP